MQRQPLRVLDRFGEELGFLVIFGEALDVIVERVDCRRGEDANLPHRAAQRFAMPASAIDRFARTTQRRPDGRAETLAEANADRVKMLTPPRRLNSRGYDGVEQSRAV